MVSKIFPYLYLLLSYLLFSALSHFSRTKIFFYLSISLVLIFVGFKDIMSPDFERYAVAF